MLAFIFTIALLLCTVNDTYSTTCTYQKRPNAPEVYWINMDKSVVRKDIMARTLTDMGFSNHRIRGLTPNEIFIPDDIENTWRTRWCMLQTAWNPPDKLSETYFGNKTAIEQYGQYSAYTAALCGRGKMKNTPKELGCTTSHLVAMYNAIYSTTAKSRYAVIVEDDVSFPFDIDYEALTKTAPAGFGILQLFNSNENSMKSTWDMYVKDNNYLWTKSHAYKYFDFWSTCAYLIDRFTMKPIVDAVINKINGWYSLKIIAGINNPCVPMDCCPSGTDNFIHKAPCVWAPRGYQADSFLYAMTNTYMLSMPVISNGAGSNLSTFHQDHVEGFHRSSFRRQRRYINEMLQGRVPIPSFLKPACSAPMDVDHV